MQHFTMSLITNIVCKLVCIATRYLTLERVETTVKERGYFWAANRIREGCSRWRGRFPLLFFPIDVVAAVNFLSFAAEGVTRLEVTLWPMGGPRFVNSIGFLWIFVLGIKKLLMNWGVYSSHGTRTLKRGRRVRGKSECAASAGYRDFEGWCKYSSKQERKIEGREERDGGIRGILRFHHLWKEYSFTWERMSDAHSETCCLFLRGVDVLVD